MKTEKGHFYIHDSDKRYRIISTRVLDSWSPHRVIESSEAAVSKYRIAARLRFRNGSLIWNVADGKIYLIEDGKRRHIVSPEAFDLINANRFDAIAVSEKEVKLHQPGEDLS